MSTFRQDDESPSEYADRAVKTSHSYFVVMVDHPGLGLEAIVQPERTRRDIVSMIASGEFKDIAFIHAIEGLYIFDCTEDLLEEAARLEAA